ncbi:MAG TPA: methyltransferase domain-containing protein [Pseudonocardiaceae bacterium]|jgi:SAM-dependent methyltransferase|nr:methyltransferase domain-containing protein [Pseudonocardiaceae bacterium]
MGGEPGFEELVAEGESVPLAGWDFSWFDGRATEERPTWGYSRLIGQRMASATTALDIQTGGGEVLAGIPFPPKVLVATESWPPNLKVAARNLRPLGAAVLATADEPALPFQANTFDLVVSRHPVHTWWDEIGRVLRPGGTYLSQQIGQGTVRELREAMVGKQPLSSQRATSGAVAEAEGAGLVVVDLRQQALRTVFHDIAAVVHFLRKVVWTVPDFSVDRYRDRLRTLHNRIQAEGSFVTYAQRFLIEARKPVPAFS